MCEILETSCLCLPMSAGVDNAQLSFSWKLDGLTAQSAYQIAIKNRSGETLFDSQKVLSADSVRIWAEIEGLRSSEQYTYRIRVWDQDDNVSEWSKQATFLTGVMSPDSWSAYFICVPSDSKIDPMSDAVWYVKDFNCEESLALAVIHVGSVGYHNLYVNGQKVGERVMSPVRCRIQDDKRVLYVTYDLTEHLKKGRNRIGILADAGWAREAKAVPAVIARLSLKNGSKEKIIGSGADWLCKASGIRHIGKFEWGDFGGEAVCGENRELQNSIADIGGTDWTFAQTVAIKAELSADLTDGDGIFNRFSPLTVENEESSCIIDMGKNYTGWAQIKLHGGKPGQRVTISVSDKLSEQVSFGQVSEYLFTGKEGIFQNQFNTFSGRYLHVEGLSEPVHLKDITALEVGSLLQQTASFASSNPLLNQIYSADVDTFRATTLNGVTVDSPHRERLGYGETGISTMWGIGLHAFEMSAFYRNVFQNWRDCQSDNGYLPHVAPNGKGGGGTTWSSCLTISLHDYLSYYPDEVLLQENFQAVLGWANFLCAHIENGMLVRYPEDAEEWGFLGDWATYEGDDWGKSRNALFFNNCVVVYVLSLTSELAKRMKDDASSRRYDAVVCEMRNTLHDRYYDIDKKQYLGGEQRYLAIALCAGIVPQAEQHFVLERLADSLREKQYLDAGSAGMVFLLRAAGEYLKQPQLIYQILNCTTCPGYGYFIQNGQNVWPEMWDMRGIYGGSRIHTCYTGIAGWITRYLTGVQNLGKVTRRFKLVPYFPEDMIFLQSSNDYGYGKITTYWQKEPDGRITYTFTVPANTQTEFYPPEGYLVDKTNLPVSTVFLSGTHTLILIPAN